MSSLTKFKPIFIKPASRHTSSIIFLHGSGDTGDGVREWVRFLLGKDLQFENTKIIFPTAPLRPYTPMNGAMASVWFDRKQISPFVDEGLSSLDAMCQEMMGFIDEETKSGIPKNRIMIGGFSMGGALALHMGYRFCREVAGIFALSSFLNENSVVYNTIEKHKKQSLSLPPLFQCHGTMDPLVHFEWGKRTADTLSGLGVDVTFHKYENMYHEMKEDELIKLKHWLVENIYKDCDG